MPDTATKNDPVTSEGKRWERAAPHSCAVSSTRDRLFLPSLRTEITIGLSNNYLDTFLKSYFFMKKFGLLPIIILHDNLIFLLEHDYILISSGKPLIE
jgi:hypothetical protein